MPKPLDPKSKNILEFRPRITFVEPEVQAGVIDPIVEDAPQLEEAYQDVEELKKLADAVNTLATATQARVDELAKNVKMAVTEDDDAVLQAMARLFPDASPNEITYEQYRGCKERLLKEGVAIGDQLVLAPADIAPYKDCAKKAIDNENCPAVGRMGGYGTPESKDGRLRPELQKRGMAIKPLNYKKVKAKLLCMLANMLWKDYMMKAFRKAKIPKPVNKSIASLLPSSLCNPGGGFKTPDIDALVKKGGTDFKETSGKATTSLPPEAPEK